MSDGITIQDVVEASGRDEEQAYQEIRWAFFDEQGESDDE